MKRLGEQVRVLTEEAGGKWSVYIENLTDGGDFSLNKDDRHYAASIIKLPILATVFRLADQGSLRLSEPIMIEDEDLVGGAGVLQHLKNGSPYTLYDLAMLMIIQSDNTATNMLIERVGVGEIQKTMQAIGMDASSFYNKLMIVPAELEGSNMITAQDMAIFLKALAKGQMTSLYACDHMVQIMKKQQIHYMTSTLPSASSPFVGGQAAWEWAGKTGSVTRVRHDVGLFYGHGKTYLVVILASECDHVVSLPVIAKIGELVYDQMKGGSGA